jgi:hypothetical protein
MLNKDVLAYDPSDYRLADGGVAKVSFPPDDEQKAILREQLQTFVCEGAYADGLQRMLESFNAAAGRRGDVPAAWISGFYGSGKSLLAAMLGALWVNLEFEDGVSAEGLVQAMPAEIRAALRELRANAARLGGLAIGGTTLGRGAQHPVQAVLNVILEATGLPSGGDIRPALVALWLDAEGALSDVRRMLGANFDRAAGEFLLDDKLAAAALEAKPGLAPDVDTLRDRLGRQFERAPEPTVELLVDTARKALTVGRREMPLTLIILDEVQQYVRENSDIALVIQTIAEELSSKFRGRVFLVGTGQSALGDVRYLERLLTRFVIPIPLGSADINSVIRQTVLMKKDAAKPEIERMLDLPAGEIDKHLQGSSLKHTAADQPHDVADWPILAARRRFWERVLVELDRSGLAATLRGQLRISLDAVRRYGESQLGVAVPGDFLFDTFAAEALWRNLILREIYDRIATLRAQPGDGLLKARMLILVYLIGRIAGDAQHHGIYARPDILADLLVEDLGNAAPVRAKVPDLLEELRSDGAIIEISGEWRLQTKESAEWQAAFNRAQAQAAGDPTLVPRHRSSLLQLAIDEVLAGLGTVQHGSSKTPRRIERVIGDARPASDGLMVRLWNGWDHPIAATLNEIKAADVAKDATIHLVIPVNRAEELRNAIVAREAATATIQSQGRDSVLWWDNGRGELARSEQARIQGREAWDREGVIVRLMRALACSLYHGDLYDQASAVVVPNDRAHLPAIWAFCSSPEYAVAVRQIDRKLNVTNATLVKVPFDLAYWQKVAAEKYPNGLPEPYSDDPTQWLFHGHPRHAEAGTELHAALARLAGYRWPAESDAAMRLSAEARARIAEAATLPEADADGLLPLVAVRGERPLADRLRAWCAAAWGDGWSQGSEAALIAAACERAKDKPPKQPTFDAWLRSHAARQHANLFHERPFLWWIKRRPRRRVYCRRTLPPPRPCQSRTPRLHDARRLDHKAGRRSARRGRPHPAKEARADPRRRDALRHLRALETARPTAARLEPRSRRRRAPQHPPVCRGQGAVACAERQIRDRSRQGCALGALVPAVPRRAPQRPSHDARR